MKKLYRSRTNKIVSGLLGGVGEYFNVDPVIIRIIFLFLLVLTKLIPGILIYIFGALVVPRHPDETIRDADIEA